MKRFLTIDPGISGTGIALFENKKLVFWKNIYPVETDHFQKRADSLITRLEDLDLVGFKGLENVFCEWPTGRFSNAAGIAAHNSDAILKLTYLIGRLESLFDGGMTLIPVVRWKGSLPKTVVAKRVSKWLSVNHWSGKFPVSHAMDATGIGKYVIEETEWLSGKKL